MVIKYTQTSEITDPDMRRAVAQVVLKLDAFDIILQAAKNAAHDLDVMPTDGDTLKHAQKTLRDALSELRRVGIE